MSIETLAIGLGIVAFLVLTQLGHKSFTPARSLIPLAVIAYVASRFLPAVPMTGPNLVALGVSALAGIAMGLSLLACIKVGREPSTGTPYTEAGIPYLMVWVALLLAREVFVYGIQHWFTTAFGAFLVANHISVNAIAPAFILAAGAILLTRLAGILWRISRRPRHAVAMG